jgi:hypothetical protein
MTTEEAIVESIRRLPDEVRQEVLDFADFLHARLEQAAAAKEHAEWSELSLESAMRDMADEPDLYNETDLKERFC